MKEKKTRKKEKECVGESVLEISTGRKSVLHFFAIGVARKRAARTMRKESTMSKVMLSCSA